MFLFWYYSSVIDVLSRVVYFQKNRDFFGKRETSTNPMLGKSSKKHMVSLISYNFDGRNAKNYIATLGLVYKEAVPPICLQISRSITIRLDGFKSSLAVK